MRSGGGPTASQRMSSSEMFNDLEYFWQTSLMEPVGGMDMIWKGFLPQKVGPAEGDTVESLVTVGQPVRSIDIDGGQTIVTTTTGSTGWRRLVTVH